MFINNSKYKLTIEIKYHILLKINRISIKTISKIIRESTIIMNFKSQKS